MRLTQKTVRLLTALCLLASPIAGFAAEHPTSEHPTAPPSAAQPSATGKALAQPLKSVYDNYIAIQKQLASDSIKGIDEHASAIAKAVNGDTMKMLPADVAKEADTLAAAKDIKQAREAFKPLSASLIKYLADNNAGRGVYHEAYCPMAKASWLQSEKQIKNPYYGKSMLDCGTLKN